MKEEELAKVSGGWRKANHGRYWLTLKEEEDLIEEGFMVGSSLIDWDDEEFGGILTLSNGEISSVCQVTDCEIDSSEDKAGYLNYPVTIVQIVDTLGPIDLNL